MQAREQEEVKEKEISKLLILINLNLKHSLLWCFSNT